MLNSHTPIVTLVDRTCNMPMTQRLCLDKPYLRINKDALNNTLTNHNRHEIIKKKHMPKSIGMSMHAPSSSIMHDKHSSIITLTDDDDRDDCIAMQCKLITDCAGHKALLTLCNMRLLKHAVFGVSESNFKTRRTQGFI